MTPSLGNSGNKMLRVGPKRFALPVLLFVQVLAFFFFSIICFFSFP